MEKPPISYKFTNYISSLIKPWIRPFFCHSELNKTIKAVLEFGLTFITWRTFGESIVSGFDFNVVRGIYNPWDQKISFPTEDANSVQIVEFLREKVFVCYLHACKNKCFHGRSFKYERRGFTFDRFIINGVWYYVSAYRYYSVGRREGSQTRFSFWWYNLYSRSTLSSI